jgi:hypothetical protein
MRSVAGVKPTKTKKKKRQPTAAGTPEQGRIGSFIVTDGPFTETKELGGAIRSERKAQR